MSAIVVSEAVRVPASAITVRATRASGPGGQNHTLQAGKRARILAPRRRAPSPRRPVAAPSVGRRIYTIACR